MEPQISSCLHTCHTVHSPATTNEHYKHEGNYKGHCLVIVSYGGHTTQEGNHTGYHSPYSGHTTHLTRKATCFTASREPYTHPQAESPTRTPNPDPLHQQGEQQVEATNPISHTPPATDKQPCPFNIHTRPLRARHPPKRYEPETASGWIIESGHLRLIAAPGLGGGECRVYTMKYFILVTTDHVVRGTIVVVVEERVSQIKFARLYYVLLLYISPFSFLQTSARKIIQPSCK